MNRLFVIGDSPTKHTGFGRVMRNLVTQWQASGKFDEIVAWGIHYWGIPHDLEGIKIYPAGTPADDRWSSQGNLTRCATLIDAVRPTHIFMLQDLWGLTPLCQVMREFERLGTKSLLYFPVDAPLEPAWTRIIASVTKAVAYCEYGRNEARAALKRPEADTCPPEFNQREWAIIQQERYLRADKIDIVPHGIDEIFKPASKEERLAIRKDLMNGMVAESDFLMVVVAQNQRRKGLTQSLQLLAELKRLGQPAKLWMHMDPHNKDEGIDLRLVAHQLGLKLNGDVFFAEQFHKHGQPVLTDNGLAQIYNAADLLLSTSLGEGWGLPLTEAMACRVPVAGPGHTSVGEILADGRGLILPLGQADVVPGDNNRIRHRIQVHYAAAEIDRAIKTGRLEAIAETGYQWAIRPEMQWSAIAKQWLDLMGV